MKFNLLSDNKKIVDIVMLAGSLLICAGVIMQIASIAANHSLWLLGLGSLVVFWSAFSHNIVKTKESGIKPTYSKIIGNISFLILAVFWSIFLTWIYVKTQ
ncbi:hypothetical protein C6501_03035 [Candidatus Poribacteria bacterium]|nr:MAG: hypothetical protein C6501_03035 [Candidatus Poribacteria bacterium]